MHLGTPTSAIISAVIFNALIIPFLIPLSLRGVRYRAVGATALLRRNLLIYGLGGDHPAVHRHQADRPGRPQRAGCVSGARRHSRERGHHRILLGAAAGVGKTYRMLLEGRQAARRAASTS